MPGPKPTPSSTFYLADPRTLALLAIIVSFGGRRRLSVESLGTVASARRLPIEWETSSGLSQSFGHHHVAQRRARGLRATLALDRREYAESGRGNRRRRRLDRRLVPRLADGRVRVIRHDERIGVAYWRDEASRTAGKRAVLSRRSSARRSGIASIAALSGPRLPGHYLSGHSRFRIPSMAEPWGRLLPPSSTWTLHWPLAHLAVAASGSPATAVAPPYLLPRSLYPKIAWSPQLRGWGASEASVGLKAFFSGTEILHYGGPLALHRFRDQFHYETTWEGLWRNHALIARICFDDASWFGYWLPRIFEPHLTPAARHAALEASETLVEHEQFLRTKVRTDRQFWTDLLFANLLPLDSESAVLALCEDAGPAGGHPGQAALEFANFVGIRKPASASPLSIRSHVAGRARRGRFPIERLVPRILLAKRPRNQAHPSGDITPA